jgi:hypothetical protein
MKKHTIKIPWDASKRDIENKVYYLYHVLGCQKVVISRGHSDSAGKPCSYLIGEKE